MIRNVWAQYSALVSPVIVVVLGIWLGLEIRHNHDLTVRLLVEKGNNQRYRDLNRACDQEQARLGRESVLKDNKTAEIWSKLGVCENLAEKYKSEKEVVERDLSEKTKNFVKNQDADRKCVADLTELRTFMDKRRSKEEDNFFLFQQKFKNTPVGVSMVDVLDMFRYSRADVEEMVNKLIDKRKE